MVLKLGQTFLVCPLLKNLIFGSVSHSPPLRQTGKPVLLEKSQAGMLVLLEVLWMTN